ncbi:MAG TPA: redoxin domain-containing protein [Bacteroides graminisolvens]|nr:redoxin domain-containing protein [Bacteroides graminisolvens]
MKTTIISTIFILILAIITLLSVGIIRENKRRELFNSKLESIINAELYTLESRAVRVSELYNQKKIVIIYFDTYCDICRIEAKEFFHLKAQFKDSDIIFISSNTTDEIKKFIVENKLSQSNIHFLNDKNYLLIKEYDISNIPFIILYINNRIHKTYKGAINIKQIIKDKNEKEI